MSTALVVDDQKVDQRLAGRLLREKLGLTIVYADNGREALASIEQQLPDVLVTDIMMPVMDGLELVEAIRREHPTMPVIMMTALGSEELAAEALQRGATSYVKSIIPDPTDPRQADQDRGRVLVLIHTVMDEVSYNDTGSEITLLKRRRV